MVELSRLYSPLCTVGFLLKRSGHPRDRNRHEQWKHWRRRVKHVHVVAHVVIDLGHILRLVIEPSSHDGQRIRFSQSPSSITSSSQRNWHVSIRVRASEEPGRPATISICEFTERVDSVLHLLSNRWLSRVLGQQRWQELRNPAVCHRHRES